MTEDNADKEPITIVDNRKIDPDSNELRQPSADNGVAAAPASNAEVGVDTGVDADIESDAGVGSDARQLADTISSELAERTADLQRLTAEYANYRRRVERDRQATIDSAKAAIVTELLGVLDDLDRARSHGDLESGPLKSVADKLSAALVKQGLTEFGSEGEPFDPTVHEAVQHEGSGHDPVIGIVMRKGYRFGDRVLRHALVGVTDGVSDLADDADRAAEEASDVDAGAQER
ncbi:nucleotide exchange factor GrpE [Nocardia sp. CNY236]|uniref:nucleotide exchange factor GrpE n=1 Tax=Nocardia sp. CNY236 TaxID=1169152 RepID=UPI00040EF9EF|nr:nucleotide exchange factor GrpE [Nocardia sp. CNY236]